MLTFFYFVNFFIHENIVNRLTPTVNGSKVVAKTGKVHFFVNTGDIITECSNG